MAPWPAGPLVRAQAAATAADMRFMDGISTPLLASLASLAVLAVGAAGAVFWQQRRATADLRRQLARAEESRRELADRVRELAQHLQSRPAPAEPVSDTAERRAALERALDTAAAVAPADFPWLETMPTENEDVSYAFASTLSDVDLPLPRR